MGELDLMWRFLWLLPVGFLGCLFSELVYAAPTFFDTLLGAWLFNAAFIFLAGDWIEND